MDALIAIMAVVALIVPFLLLKLYWWAGLLGAITAVVAGFELTSYLLLGRTLSQQFWVFRKEHQKASWWLLGLLAVAWAGLLVHLGWK